jgi:hypothetical protein
MERITVEEAKKFIPVKEYFGLDKIKDRIRGAEYYTSTPSELGDGWEEITYYTNIKKTNIMSQQQEMENLKVDLVNDLISISTVMEELWKYHPENPNKVDIASEYIKLEEMKKGVETELDDLGI